VLLFKAPTVSNHDTAKTPERSNLYLDDGMIDRPEEKSSSHPKSKALEYLQTLRGVYSSDFQKDEFDVFKVKAYTHVAISRRFFFYLTIRSLFLLGSGNRYNFLTV
jgi:hypothetical protein